MARVQLLCALLSLQYLGGSANECPQFRKDIQWMKGEKGTIQGSSSVRTVEDCQTWCQDFSKMDDRTYMTTYPCVGWSFWAESGPWAHGSWCYLFDNSSITKYGVPLEETGVDAPGAVSGLKYDCNSGKGPSVIELVLEGLTSLRLENGTLPDWKYIMADEMDLDLDSEISDSEIEYKFNLYLEYLFFMMDHNKDGIVTEQELRSFKVNLPFLNTFLDVIFENFPTKTLLKAADTNKDGVWDENDFYLPEYSTEELMKPPYLDSSKLELNDSGPGLRLRWGDASHQGKVWINNQGVCNIEEKEGEVICRELGFVGLERITRQYTFGDREIFPSQSYQCNGNEQKLEDCQRERDCYGSNYDGYDRSGRGVVCKEELGSLRLIGGKDSSSGDIFLGNRALGCAPWCGRRGCPDWQLKQAKVICRELGFPGVDKITRGKKFTKNFRPKPQGLDIEKFECQGDETRLKDCQIIRPGESGNQYDTCSEYEKNSNIQGVICSKTDVGRNYEVRNASAPYNRWERTIDWDREWNGWEKFERKLLFIADDNNDGKLTLEEIKSKFKKYLATAFQFVDQNADGFLSIEDFTSLHMAVNPIHKVMDIAFEKFQNDGIDVLQALQSINKEVRFEPYGHNFDLNNDNKLTAEDLRGSKQNNPPPSHDWKGIPYEHGHSSSYQPDQYMQHGGVSSGQPSFLLPLLNLKLDKNQDGKLEREEARQFTNDMFKKLDKDGDGFLTFEDGFRLMEEYGESCISILQWRDFLPKAVEAVQTQFRAMMSYGFMELDKDGNGQIDSMEFEKLHIPCATSRKEVDIDPRRIKCSRVLDRFFFRNKEAFDLWVPPIPIIGKRREQRKDELAEAACKMLS